MARDFKDPIAPKQRKNGNNPWNYDAPPYDHRSSESISCGNDYGLGFRVPSGKFSASSVDKGPIPQKSSCLLAAEYLAHEDKKG